jgi:hypothetical protein
MAVYRERIHWPPWFHAAVGAAWLVFAAALAGLAVSHGPRYDHLIGLGFLVLLALAWWRVRFLEVDSGPEGMTFGFGRRLRTAPRARIVSIAEEHYSPVRYMGWGLRLGWTRGERVYSVLGVPGGLRIVYDDDRGLRWNVFVSCREPARVIAAMEPEA